MRVLLYEFCATVPLHCVFIQVQYVEHIVLVIMSLLSWIHFHCLLFSFLYHVFTVPCTCTFDQYYSVCKVLCLVLVKPPILL